MPRPETVPTLPATEDGIIRPARLVTHAVRGDEFVLADFRQGRYYTLSPVGGRIWELLREGTTVRALLAQLHTEYDAPAQQVDADAMVFLRALHAAELITGCLS